ncbi:amidase signature enzyme [Flagelloscypha sp. PMI_526]|nr:amidase signature enzyme [Flagelloscypha sp. PMI_526]
MASHDWLLSPQLGALFTTQDKHSTGRLPDLYEASIVELQHGLDAGHFTSVDLVQAYFFRIEEVNNDGPSLRAVLETNPSALSQAAILDTERQSTGKRSLLHGIPVLLKDNIATISSEAVNVLYLGLNTTAGSHALLNAIVPFDAGVVKKLRASGAIILGKASMTEWAHYRASNMTSGWSGRSGQATNAYYPNGDPSGSSSGSAVAASIGLATVTLGTETHGSIMYPASWNNVVGVKPTVGLTSRAGVIPISSNQDSIGPIGRTVMDSAIVLEVIAGPDPNDDMTLAQPIPVPSYTQSLSKDALKGKRIGVPRKDFIDNKFRESTPVIYEAFQQALLTLEHELGAVIVDPADFPNPFEKDVGEDESFVWSVDFKIELNAYLTSLTEVPSGVRTLENLIKWNEDHPELELPENHASQEGLIRSQASEGKNSRYWAALARIHERGRVQGIDAVLQNYNLDALVIPAAEDVVTPSSIAGYPIITVPLGFLPDSTPVQPAGPTTVYPAPGMPFGLSFLGTAFTEASLLSFAYAYEQATQTRLGRRAYKEAVPKTQLMDILKG